MANVVLPMTSAYQQQYRWAYPPGQVDLSTLLLSLEHTHEQVRPDVDVRADEVAQGERLRFHTLAPSHASLLRSNSMATTTTGPWATRSSPSRSTTSPPC